MRIRKYDFNYGRRVLMEKAAKGIGTAGVLAPLWAVAGSNGDITKAYPEELLHIEAYTKGKVKVGDTINADNVEYVKDMLDPIQYINVTKQKRVIGVVATTTDISTLFNKDYLEATLRNKGRATWAADGNLSMTNGQNWAGGVPFMDPKDGKQAKCNVTMSWGRHGYSGYPIISWDLGPSGDLAYNYHWFWAELQYQARADGRVYGPNKDLLRIQTVFFTAPDDFHGASFLSNWYYDQRKFPELYGYLPAFKRVRQFPTNQRFEPIAPGMTFFLSDAWSAGDPLLTWGDFKLVERKPFLGAMSDNWQGDRPNWMKKKHGGPKGQTFMETYFQMIPEVVVVDEAPTGFPRAPVGRRRVWIDARNMMYCSSTTFDRQGKLWKSFETGSGRMAKGKLFFPNHDGTPAWSWDYVHCHDIQADRMTQIFHAETCNGGYHNEYDSDYDYYNKFLTTSAIARLGAA
jgi:hypothetical protein